ncbi:MAG: hypothetical protein LBU82_04915 [Treponema sp.]|jgi:hypothetical protein|nr:hypothetical protein [Treponema sp.]
MAFKRFAEVIAGPKGGEGVVINGLRIAFSIEKTDSPNPNKSRIIIYNLSNDTHAKIAVAGNHVTLKAGYEDETIAAIFFGDVLKGSRKKDGTDTVTELEVFDGRTAVMSGQVTMSYAKNTEARTIIQAFVDAIGLAHKGMEKVPAGEKYPHGYAFIGMAGEGLKDVLNRYGLIYTIQNEMLYIIKPGEAADKTGLKLTAETGLLTIPEPVSDKTSDDDVKTEPGNLWKFSTMLFPELIPGAACKVESSSLNSEVIIKTALFNGDNWDGDYKVDIVGEMA